MSSFNPSIVERPKSINEACSLLESHSGKARIVAGNTTLYELGKQGALGDVDVLIDLSRIGLNYIRKENEKEGQNLTLLVGAGTTFSEIASAPISFKDSYYALKEVSSKITPLQIRNTGTIGGAACSGIPFYDIPTVIVALDAKMKIVNSRQEKLLDAKDFFVDYFTTALSEEDLLTEIQFQDKKNSGSAFVKLGRTSVDFSVVNACARILLEKETEIILDARIVLGAVSNVPVRANAAEQELIGKKVSDKLFVDVSKRAADFDPTPSVHASANYKLRVIPILVRDALKLAASRANIA